MTFMNGTTALGTATLSAAGTAVLTSSTLASGAYVVNAVYSGNVNLKTASTTTSALTVADFTLTATSPTLTMSYGKTGPTTITITPIENYKGTITLACGQLPANVSACSFSNVSPTLDGTGTPTTVTLTVTANTSLAQAEPRSLLPRSRILSASFFYSPAVFAGLFFAFGGKSRRRWQVTQGLLLVIVSIGLMGLVACSSSSKAPLPAESTSLVVTGSGATPLAHAINLTVTTQ